PVPERPAWREVESVARRVDDRPVRQRDPRVLAERAVEERALDLRPQVVAAVDDAADRGRQLARDEVTVAVPPVDRGADDRLGRGDGEDAHSSLARQYAHSAYHFELMLALDS